MPLRFKRIQRAGPIPRRYWIVHLSRCEHCYHWERSRYVVVGTCRRHPYPRRHTWEKCPAWTTRYERLDIWRDFLAGDGNGQRRRKK